MRHSILFTATILFLLACGDAGAQSNIANIIPWNGYDSVEVSEGPFNSIIGNGGVLIAGSANAGQGAAPFTLPAHPSLANVPIRFLQQDYTPANLRISASGWISFNGSSEPAGSSIPELRYTRSTVYPYFNKVLMVYWSNLVTQGVTNGGIWWKVDSILGRDYRGADVVKRYLAIEWSVRRGGSLPAPAGRFQARIFASYRFPLNSEIELYYGPESINHPPPTADNSNLYGAQVGIKNFGQTEGDPEFIGDSLDREKFLIVLHPDSVPSPAFKSITRLRTTVVPRDEPSAAWYQPEWWASYGRYPTDGPGASNRYASRFFHYAFPPMMSVGRMSYRMKPVEVDMGTIAMAINGLDPSVANAFEPGSSIQPTATFANLGGYRLYNVPVAVRIDMVTKGGIVPTEHTFSDTIDSIDPGERIELPMYIRKGFSIQSSGYYRVVIYTQFSEDRNRFNDTLVGDFVIKRQNDIAAWRVLLPVSSAANISYPFGEQVPLLARFMNVGFNRREQVQVGYRVTNMNGVPVDSGTAPLPTLEPGDSTETLFLTSWTPPAPGRYFVRFFVVGGDDIPQNDTLPRSSGHPFDVRFTVDLAAAPAGNYPHAPGINRNYLQGEEIPVQAAFINNGIADAVSVPARVRIAKEDGTVVYNQEASLRVVPAQGHEMRSFPAFTPADPGRYCAMAIISAPEDPISLNDTSRWCFTVSPSSGVEKEEKGSALRLAIHPNPARDKARIDFTAPGGAGVKIGVHDIYSREVMRWEGRSAGGAETIEADLATLPAGVYIVRMELSTGEVWTGKVVVER